MGVIRAAGGLLWRDDGGTRRIAVIHRPRRKDWSLPKGKLVGSEGWEAAALREVQEETGCEASLESFAGVAFYVARRTPKVVLYWNMSLVREGALDDNDEVDEVAWLPPAKALERLDRERDREILQEALHLPSPGEGETKTGGAGARLLSRAGSAGLALSCAGALVLALWARPAGLGWPLLGAAACGALAGGAVSVLLGTRRRG
jgi:8-oxo-dGTP diphosphatase